MNIRRIMLAAPVSGSGKTLLTCGILELFRRHGEHPCAFKCGPDYIDPMFHRVVCGFAGANLDSFFLPPEKVRNLFTETCRRENAGSAVLEGVMGYYDGVSGTTEQASSYDISRITKTPVILVVNARGTSLSAAALVRGFQEFRPDSRIAGVLLNRCRKEVAAMIGSVIEENCHIPVVGYVPMEKEFEIKDRHLGLYLPHEMADIHDRIKKLADRMEETVDWEKLSAIADSAEELPETDSSEGRTSPEMNGTAQEEIRFRVALAKDEAFCFYYQENMRLLESMGAEIVPFSPMHDKELPEDIDGLIIGGGYPENYGPILSENRTMLSSVWSALEGKMPLLAECGGFEYLHESVRGSDGVWYPMAGYFDLRAERNASLGHFGYVTVTLPDGSKIRSHEFHYWESTDPGDAWLAEKPNGKRWRCEHDIDGVQYAGFPHLYYPSAPAFARKFAENCRAFRKKRGRADER